MTVSPEPSATSEVTAPPSTVSGIVTRAGMVAWAGLGLLLLLGVMIWLLVQANVIVAPVVLSVVLIYVLNPIVNRLEQLRVPRVLGSVAAFVTLIGAIVLLGFLVVPSVTSQAAEFAASFPEIYDETTAEVENLLAGFNVDVDLWTYEQLQDYVTDPANQDQFLAALRSRLGAVTSGVLEAVLVFFLAPVIAFYLLIDLRRLRDETVGLLPADHRDEIVHVSRLLGHAVGGFLRGQVLVALIVGILTSLGFWIVGLPFWLIIGMTAGFLNIIPFLGPWVGGTLGVIVGLVTTDLTTALWAAVVAIAVQQIDNNFISPTVMRATVRLHPAVVILVLILGGGVAGIWGVVLAVPVTAIIKILSSHVWRTRVLGQSWEEAGEAVLEEPEFQETLIERLRRLSDAESTTVEDASSPGGGGESEDGGRPPS